MRFAVIQRSQSVIGWGKSETGLFRAMSGWCGWCQWWNLCNYVNIYLKIILVESGGVTVIITQVDCQNHLIETTRASGGAWSRRCDENIIWQRAGRIKLIISAFSSGFVAGEWKRRKRSLKQFFPRSLSTHRSSIARCTLNNFIFITASDPTYIPIKLSWCL